MKDRILDRKEEIIRSLQEMIAIPSVKSDPAEGMPFGKGVGECLDYVLELCQNLGFRTKNCNGCVGYAEAGEGAEMIGILVHLDVVPEGKNWDYPPFGGTLIDGRLYGRGAMDDKGPAVASIYALKAVIDEGIPLKKRVRIIFGLDEETDWEDMSYYVSHEECPTVGFTPDADFPAIYAEKGIVSFDLIGAGIPGLVISGGEAVNVVPDHCIAKYRDDKRIDQTIEENGVSAHSSLPESGKNAISLIMEKLHARRNDGGTAKQSDPAFSNFIDFYHDKIGMDYYGKGFHCDFSDVQSGQLTFNVGVIEVNEEKSVLSVDIRYPVSCRKEDILSVISREAEPYGMRIENINHLAPVYFNQNGELIQKLMGVYWRVTGDQTDAAAMGGGTYARAMPNIVAFGPLFPGREGTEHQKNEYILIEDLMTITEIYALAIRELMQ